LDFIINVIKNIDNWLRAFTDGDRDHYILFWILFILLPISLIIQGVKNLVKRYSLNKKPGLDKTAFYPKFSISFMPIFIIPLPSTLIYFVAKLFHLEHSTNSAVVWPFMLFQLLSFLLMGFWFLMFLNRNRHLGGKINCNKTFIYEYKKEDKNGKAIIQLIIDWSDLENYGLKREIFYTFKKFLILKVKNYEKIDFIHIPVSMKRFDEFYQIIENKIGAKLVDVEYNEFHAFITSFKILINNIVKKIRKK